MLLHIVTLLTRCSKMCLMLVQVPSLLIQRVVLASDIWTCLHHLLLYTKEHYHASKDLK